jgi:hopene-associated glycosyltransferase HpnB
MTAAIAGTVCVGIWCYLLFGRGNFWRLRESQAGEAAAVDPKRVAVIIPARNESLVVGRAIRSVLDLEHAGSLHVFLVDDESSDDTANLAQQGADALGKARQLTVVKARPRPVGWTGKLWAISEGLQRARDFKADYYLLTDADIIHDPHSLALLLARAEGGCDLVSLMVELRCQSWAERALIPASVFFFFMLYPPSWVRQGSRRTAAAAGGCILIRASALASIGGIDVIRGELIDDCALARAVKQNGGRLWLGATRKSCSIREYERWQEIGHMISRTAFTQLKHSIVLLVLVFCGICATFLLPVTLLFSGGVAPFFGIASWVLMTLAFLPTVRFYRQSPLWAPLLPFISLFYLGATISSAVQYWRGRGGAWKGRVQDPDRQALV